MPTVKAGAIFGYVQAMAPQELQAGAIFGYVQASQIVTVDLGAIGYYTPYATNTAAEAHYLGIYFPATGASYQPLWRPLADDDILATQAGVQVEGSADEIRTTQAGVQVEIRRIPDERVTQAGVQVETGGTPDERVTQAGVQVEVLFGLQGEELDCWEFHVYDRDTLEHLAVMDAAWDKQFYEQLNDVGAGSFRLHFDDDKATEANLQIGNIVKVRYRGIDYAAWIIERRRDILIAQGQEHAGKNWECSGRGTMALLEQALVYPTSLSPASDERSWSSGTRGEIMAELIDEASARGAIPLVYRSFDSIQDSDGEAWSDSQDLGYKVGRTLLDVARQHAEQGTDVYMSPTFELQYLVSKGSDKSRSVWFREGLNILDGSEDQDAVGLANVALVQGQDLQFLEVEDTSSTATWNRREVYLSAGNTSGTATMTALGETLLDQRSEPTEQISLTVVTDPFYPWEDYVPGDTVWIEVPGWSHGDRVRGAYRLRSMGIKERNGPCDLIINLELNSLRLEYLIRLARAMQDMLNANVGGSGSAGSGLSSGDTSFVANLLRVLEDGVTAATGVDRLDFRHGLDVAAGTTTSVQVSVDETELDLGSMAGSLDHGALAGLGDDDHSQYLLATGSRVGATSTAQDFGVNGIQADAISESSAGAGVTIDGVELKDDAIDAPAGGHFGGTADYATFGSNGELTLYGGATVWDDLRVPMTSVSKGGANDPDFAKVQDSGGTTTGVYSYHFDKNTEEELFFSVQLPHTWRQESGIEPHAHWAPTDAGTGTVVWGLEYTWANIGSAFPATSLLTVADPGDGTADKHQLASFGTIDGAGFTHSSMLLCRVYRAAGATSDNYDADAALLEVDFHYEINSLGESTAP